MIMGIRHAWLAYQFNEIIWLDGRGLEAKLNERDDKGRPVYTPEMVFSVDRGGSSLVDMMMAAGVEKADF